MLYSSTMRAMEGWEKVRVTVSAEALLRVAFHQLSKTTWSRGHCSPEDFMFNELSGLNMETGRPSPTCREHESVRANMVALSETMSTYGAPFAGKPQAPHSRAYSIRSDIFPMVCTSLLPVAPRIWTMPTFGQCSIRKRKTCTSSNAWFG